MKLALTPRELAVYVNRQLDRLFPLHQVPATELEPYVDRALERLDRCFRHLRLKYFQDAAGETLFDPLHTDQHAMFLYTLGNTVWREVGGERLAARLYALNKALHAVDLYHEVSLPDIWCLQHPVGAVAGRATYSDYLCLYQGALVGVGLDGAAPVLGRGVVLFGGASVVGKCRVGDNVWLSTGAAVFNQDVPSNSLVTGRSPDLQVRPTSRDVVKDFFTLLPPPVGAPGRA